MKKNDFNLQEQVDNWATKIQSKPSFTEPDIIELKNHLLDSINVLKKKNLTDEEAFLVALKRIGDTDDCDYEYDYYNKPVIQMRRSLTILAGVMVYFFLYYLISSSSKLLVISLLSGDINEYIAVNWGWRFLITCLFVVIVFLISIYFLDKKTIAFIEKIKMRPKHTVIFLTITFLLGVADTCLYVIVKSLLGDNYPLRSNLNHLYSYFQYSFPLIFGIIFVLIYFKYYKQTKIS